MVAAWSPPWDVFGVGAAAGSVVGLYGGYQLRKLVLCLQDWSAWRRERASSKPGTIAQERDKIVQREKPPVIPLARTPKFATLGDDECMVTHSANPDRDDVIAALVGAGFKKTEAAKAADACSLTERASGLQQWTVAALRNVAGAKQ